MCDSSLRHRILALPINLPLGHYNRLYLLAASAEGDQQAGFIVGSHRVNLNIENWGGFIGQWDDRQWVGKDVTGRARPGRPARTRHDEYAEMTGLTPGYIKRADLGWYCSHHHDKAGQNVPYAYSYLFAYSLDLPPGTRTVTLPKQQNIRLLAMSVAEEHPQVKPVQPLYDTLARVEPIVK